MTATTASCSDALLATTSDPSAGPVVDSRAQTPTRGRDRYIDSLRVLALARVLLYHLFGWVWLPILFPSMGIMFALAGSLVAASLDHETRHYGYVLRKRLWRLLPPVWAVGLILVPIMVALGWSNGITPDGVSETLDWGAFAWWIVPFAAPAASALGQEWVFPLWYLTAYLWLVLLSPALLWLFRRWPRRMLALPLIVVVMAAGGIIELDGRSGDVILNVTTYAGCWMLGFAHHDGVLRRMRRWVVLTLGLGAASFGLWWAWANPSADTGANVSDIPVASAFYGLGVVLILLHLYLDMSWLHRFPLLDRVISAMNRRAMTIYLWGNVAIAATWALVERWQPLAAYLDSGDHPVASGCLLFTLTSVLLGVMVLALGWVEDVAARRRVRLLP
ncbi:MAG: acyltransferase [Micrococcales bacterium]|nr:acyltransferase [Micrococcales bacterium]